MSAHHVFVVDLVVGDGHLEAFMPLMVENARASLSSEPGCLRSDICQDADDPSRMLLYELYDDEAAFAAHLASPHFRTFETATSSMLATKSVRTMRLRAG